MNKILKRTCAAFLAACCVCLAACSDDVQSDTETEDNPSGQVATRSESSGYDPNDTWAIYWYLCGSDLESNYGAATEDLDEMMQADLPDNVQVIIQTGGAAEWQNDEILADQIGRYSYSSNGFELVDELPQANMGDPDTLTDFLSFCKENYPADHTAVIFWNHGGGSVSGAAFDENYQFDSLTLAEMYSAFHSVYELSQESPPMELVGFDACLMATIDTAYTFADVARYLVASEEMEPGNGWYYTGWLEALAENPGMDGAQLGQSICDSFVEGCNSIGTGDEITLSVLALNKLSPLLAAYDNIGKEALEAACADPIFFTKFGRSAISAENYGGNTENQGYFNMVDLGDLVRNSEGILPEHSNALLDALDSCVVYKVNGPYRENSTGVSCYYPYGTTDEEFEGFTQMGASEPFKYLYGYGLSGTLTEEGMQYVENMGYEELQPLPTVDNESLNEQSLTVDDEGNATLTVGRENAEMISAIYLQLAYIDPDEDIILYLGRDNDLHADWDSGVFKDAFRGVWGAIDGNLCYMEISYVGDDYNLYAVPILLNGEEYNLNVVYNFTDAAYHILGARKGLDQGTGMADKNLRQLKPGDKITTLHYIMSISGDDEDYQQVETDTFTVTDQTSFTEEDMGDGNFLMFFEMVDAQNESVLSDPISFTVEGDTITTEVGG